MNNKLLEFKQSFEKYLDEYLASIHVYEPINDAYKYSILNGGKRLRPSLTYLGAYAICGDSKKFDYLVKELAIGIELIHSYSLVHDDLPCMDNDSLRRGKPTTHIKYGAGMATITGDAMLNGAIEVMLSQLDNEMAMGCKFVNNNYIAQVKATKYILNQSGMYGMIGGQCLDIKDQDNSLTKDDLINRYILKTGALLKAALCAGAIRMEANEEIIHAFEEFADNFGLAFQIQDDILDITSSTDILGKDVHQDENNEKYTYINLIGGLDNANKDMIMYSNKAKDAIKAIENNIFGANIFYELIDDMIARKK